LRQSIWKQVEAVLPHVDAVVLSDYGKGVVSTALINALIPLAQRRGIPITVDPKVENFKHYRKVTCVTPNLQEAMQGGGVHAVRSEEDLVALGQQILKKLDVQSVLITRGEKGMSLFEKKKPAVHIPTRAREVYDVTGAGDTVIGTLTLALAAGAPLRDSAELANYAAGVVVGKIGTASVTTKELEAALRMNHHG
jgi:D-beta-D-heptose 7-phosphate kinase/D-beta-D-heptose 1-phosphate adenosyltransferase